MKKIMMLFMMVFAIAVFSSCSGGNSTPKDLAETAMDAQKSNDYDKLIDLMCDKNGTPLDKESKDQLKALCKEKAKSEDVKKMTSYKIVKEDISEDGKSAVVTVDAVYEGSDEPKQETLDMMKGEDGKWYLKMGK